MDGRQSGEGERSSAAHIARPRSNHGRRAASHGQPFAMTSSPQDFPVRSSGAFGDGTRARKGSIRNAVRRMFGRRSRDSISHAPGPDSIHPVSRHAYHKSEPPAPMPSQPELPEPGASDDARPPASLEPAGRPSLSRTTSPYALQFPHSVRLKPMDLSNQYSPSAQPLRRRKTLPNLAAEEQPAPRAGERAAIQHMAEAARFSDGTGIAAPSKSIAEVIRQDRRKSKSTDDLLAAALERSVPRKRSEEIRYWRESLRTDELPARGFSTQPHSGGQIAATRPSVSRGSDTFGEHTLPTPPQDEDGEFEFEGRPSKSATLKSSPPRHGGLAASFAGGSAWRSSGVDTETSKELEERVAKLEAGLHDFQRSLQKLTADRNRRTIVMSGSLPVRGSVEDMRSPSMLAETLSGPLEPSNYEYEYGHTMRPVTSPPRAKARSVQDDSDLSLVMDHYTEGCPPRPHRGPLTSHAPTPSRSAEFRPQVERTIMPHTTSATMAAVTPGPSETDGSNQPQEWTFRSLYQMLADERSARRKLENQLKGLRQEITELHTQVHAPSNLQSTRSSYMLAGSSSRLQDLLRSTGEASPPDTSPRSLKRQSELSAHSSLAAPVVSRFSGSDSEAFTQDFPQEYDELETPCEAYRTPREERSKWSLAEQDSEIF